MTDILQVSPTRSELLEIQKKEALAKKGHALLKKKQDVLIKEFLNEIKTYQDKKKKLYEKIKETYKSLSLDIAYTGIFVSRSLSYATQPHYDITIGKENIMGVTYPKIEVKKKERELNHTYDNSPLVSDAARKFHVLFEEIIALSAVEQKIKAISNEIKKLRRRVNSLEHIQIPKLNSTANYIRFTLEEQQRDTFIRLKTIKNRLEEQKCH